MQPFGVEAGAVWAEAPSALGGVTGQAIPLGVAGDAALEALTSRLAVAQQKLPLP